MVGAEAGVVGTGGALGADEPWVLSCWLSSRAAAHGGGVIEGRDIGSVVFPDAELKLYLTASPRTRAQRRVAEAGGDVDEIEAAIAARDHHDSNRADSPLTRADGSIVVDTTGSSIDEVLARIEVLISKGPAHQ